MNELKCILWHFLSTLYIFEVQQRKHFENRIAYHVYLLKVDHLNSVKPLTSLCAQAQTKQGPTDKNIPPQFY